MVEDFMWNAEIVEDRTTLFLTKMQGEEGFSDSEVSFDVVRAIEDWINASTGDERKRFVEQLFDLAARIHLSEPVELPLTEIVSDAVQREQWKREDRNA